MKMVIHSATKLRGQVILPASKSICNRALIISCLAAGKHMDNSKEVLLPENLSDCDDTWVMRRALKLLPDVIDIMAAGTAMRFLSAFLCVKTGTHTLTGTERMKNRPIGILVEALRNLGAKVKYMERKGFPPLRIQGGKHHGGKLQLPGNISSQYVSALLMIGPVLEGGLELTLTGNIVSRPYIDMTLELMRHYGAKSEWTSSNCIRVNPTGYVPTPFLVENDWSAASYWYEMVALSNDVSACVELPGLFEQSMQGDAAVKELFAQLGVQTICYTTESGLQGIRLQKISSPITHMDAHLVHQPDLAQTLVATCCALGIPFRFSGLQSLKIKETDRIAALCTELGKLGFPITEEEEGVLTWNGKQTTPLPEATIDTYEDHRMAMSIAPIALKTGILRINHPEVVSKSYPTYWDDLRKMGFVLEMEGNLC